MIQLHPNRTPDVVSAALNQVQTQLGMPTRLCEAWGPLTRVQVDFQGLPIQQYLTMLLRVTGGRYLLVQQIIDLQRISRRLPVVQELFEKEARWWINELEQAPQSPAFDHEQPEVNGTESVLSEDSLVRM